MILFSDCQKEIDIDAPHYEPKIVIDGWIEQGGYAHVYVTLSSPFLTNYDSLSIVKTFLNFSKVTVTSGSGEREVLTLFKKNELFPPYIFRSVSLKGETGESYLLEVNTRGKILTAETTIPEPPNALEGTFKYLSDSTGYPQVLLADPPNEMNYYLFYTKIIGYDNDFYPVKYPVLSDKYFDHSAPIEVNLYHGDKSNIREYILSEDDPYEAFDNYEFLARDSILIKCCSIDSVSFRVLNSVFFDILSAKNPFRSETAVMETNITGGIGRWTGMGIKYILLPGSDNKSLQ